jgi:hypothetical protein
MSNALKVFKRVDVCIRSDTSFLRLNEVLKSILNGYDFVKILRNDIFWMAEIVFAAVTKVKV